MPSVYHISAPRATALQPMPGLIYCNKMIKEAIKEAVDMKSVVLCGSPRENGDTRALMEAMFETLEGEKTGILGL